jgi:hypothetical protein
MRAVDQAGQAEVMAQVVAAEGLHWTALEIVEQAEMDQTALSLW